MDDIYAARRGFPAAAQGWAVVPASERKTRWDRITDADATEGWELSGPPHEYRLRKSFARVVASIRVTFADGTLRVTLGDHDGNLIVGGPVGDTTFHAATVENAKKIAAELVAYSERRLGSWRTRQTTCRTVGDTATGDW